MTLTEAHLPRRTAGTLQPHPPRGELTHPGPAAFILHVPKLVLIKAGTDQQRSPVEMMYACDNQPKLFEGLKVNMTAVVGRLMAPLKISTSTP